MQIGKRKHYTDNEWKKEFVEISEEGKPQYSTKQKLDRAKSDFQIKKAKALKNWNKIKSGAVKVSSTIGRGYRNAQQNYLAAKEKYQRLQVAAKPKIEAGKRYYKSFQKGVRKVQSSSGKFGNMMEGAFDMDNMMPDMGGSHKKSRTSGFSMDMNMGNVAPDMGMTRKKKKKTSGYNFNIDTGDML